MSVNVYLKDEIRQAEGFKTKQASGGKPTQTWDEFFFNGVKLSIYGDTRLHLTMKDLDDKFPEVFKAFVEEVTFQDSFATSPRRGTGIYRMENVVAEMDTSEYNRERYSVKMRGSLNDMPTMLNLYRAIRAGNVLPTESWETGQPSRPRAEVERDLAVAQARRDELQTALVKAQNHIEWLTGERQKYSTAFDGAMQALHLVDIKLRDRRIIWGRPLRDLVGEKIAALHGNSDIIHPGE